VKKGKKIVLRCVIALLIIGNVFQFVWNYSKLPWVAVLDQETAVAIARAVAVEEFAPLYFPSQGYVDREIYIGFQKSIMAWVVVADRPMSPDETFLFDIGTEVVIRMRDGRILNIGDAVPNRPVLFEPFT
jgi:hypothetical protein